MDEPTDGKGIVELDRIRAMVGQCSPAERLRNILADNAVPEVHDGEIPDGGVTLRPAPWRVPDQITEAMMADARVEMQRLEPLLQEASADSVRRWLIMLGNLVARQPSDADDAEMRLNALCLMFDEEPAGVFTKASLKRAAMRFKFFPSAAELGDFIAHEAAEIRKRGQRLMMIIQTGARRRPDRGDPQAPDFRWSKEEAGDYSRRLYEAKARERAELARALGLPVIPVPPQAAGESDRDYGIRLAHHAMQLCQDGERDLKRKPRVSERNEEKFPVYSEEAPDADAR